jgi:hypothetical protein
MVIMVFAALTLSTAVGAHEGHGQAAPHWHGGDLLTLALLVLAMLLWVWRRGGR